MEMWALCSKSRKKKMPRELQKHKALKVFSVFFLFFIFLFLVLLDLHFMWTFSTCSEWGAPLQLQCSGFSWPWLLLLQSTGSRGIGFSNCGSRAPERGPSSCGLWA